MKILLILAGGAFLCGNPLVAADRLRLIIETDAGGDPDDEQSLVRFLLYANEWDVEGIIANRPKVRAGENQSPETTGLGVVHRLLDAYGDCWGSLKGNDGKYPTKEYLRQRTVAGYDDTVDAVNLIVSTVDRQDPRPVWYSDWGTDNGAATNNMKRALDLVLRERGRDGYAKFKSKLRLTSYDKFGEHTNGIDPPFKLWVNTFQPPLEGKRWYHRFSALTATAGGFDVRRDLLQGHGALGALYPTNTTHPQKEGDSMTFLYLVPTGMNEPEQPTWGSWAGRYGLNENFPGKPYYWANQSDEWNGTNSRDNTLARWAAALQNDFRARLDWCVKKPEQANHPPVVKINGSLQRSVTPGGRIDLDATPSTDPDGDRLSFHWEIYSEPSSFHGTVTIDNRNQSQASFTAPASAANKTLHVILNVTDSGNPPLTRYARILVTASN